LPHRRAIIYCTTQYNERIWQG